MARHGRAGQWGGAVAVVLLLVVGLTAVWGIAGASHTPDTTIIVDPGAGGCNEHNTTIQGAINHADPGDTILVCAGTYNENLTVNESVVLTTNESATLNGQDAGATAFTVAASNVTIENFEIRNYTDSAVGTDGGINDNITVRTNQIRFVGASVGGSAIHIGGTSQSNWTIRDNTITDFSGPGVDINPSSSELASDIVVAGNTIEGGSQGILIFTPDGNVSDVLIEGNDIGASSPSITDGIEFQTRFNANVTNVTFADNQVVASSHGVFLFPHETTLMADIRLENNSFNVGGSGIRASANDNSTITEFRILDNSAGNAGMDGIEVEGPGATTLTDVNVSGNNVSQSGGIGVLLDNVSDSVVRNNNASFATAAGIELRAVSGTVVRDNDANGVEAITKGGISINGGENNDISGNNLIDNTAFGITVTSTSRSNISNNILDSNPDAIKLTDTNAINISSNILTDNDIRAIESENITILGNQISGGDQGLLLERTNHSAVRGNNINVIGEGIHIVATSTNNDIRNNTVTDSSEGIQLTGTADDPSTSPQFNVLEGNTLTGNLVGINLSESYNNTLLENNASDNSQVGIWLVGADDNELTDNEALGNGQADYRTESDGVNNSVVNLTLTTANVSFDSLNVAVSGEPSPPADPEGNVSVGVFLNATNTSQDSWLDINVSYDESDLGVIPESSLSLWKHNGSWIDTEGGLDQAANRVSANITSFSTLAPIGDVDVPGTAVSRCRDISNPGRYTLVRNVTDASDNVCIDVSRGDVTFDGFEFAIDGVNGSDSIGIRALGELLSNVTVRNVSVTDWQTGIRYNRITDGEISNVTAEENVLQGASLRSSDDTLVANNLASNNGENGVHLEASGSGGAENVRIEGNQILDNGRAGINLTSGFLNDSSFAGNEISRNGWLSGSTGIHLTLTENSTNLSIRQNRLQDNVGDGVFVSVPSGGSLTALSVVGNDVNGSSSDGIELDLDSEDAVLRNASFVANRLFETGSQAFRIDASENRTTIDDLVFEANEVNDASLEAIEVDSDGVNTTVRHLRIEDNNFTSTDQVLIDIDDDFASLTDTVLRGNVILDSDDQGLEIDADDDNTTVDGLVFEDNRIDHADDESIDIDADGGNATVRDVLVQNNVFNDTEDLLIEVDDQDTRLLDVRILDNAITNSDDQGILIDAGDDRAAVERLRIERNVVNHTDDEGLVIDVNDFDTRLIDTVVRDNRIEHRDGDGEIGFYLLADEPNVTVENFLFEDNELVNARDQGIYLESTFENTSFDNVTIRGNVIDGTQTDQGIHIEIEGDLDVSDFLVTRNQITDTGEQGILVEARSGAPTFSDFVISHNRISRAGHVEIDDAIEIDLSTDGDISILVERNELLHSTSNGIDLHGASQNHSLTIVENDVVNNTAGLHIRSSFAVEETLTVRRNNFIGNHDYGIENQNETTDTWVDARDNYWGASDGPGTNTNLDGPGALADPVSGSLADGAGDNVSESSGLPADTSNVRFDTARSEPFTPSTGDGGGGGATGGGGGGGGGAPPPQPAPGQAEMVIAAASATPNPAAVGEDVTLSVTVENQGDFYGTLEVQVYVNGQATGATRRVGLPAESSETVTVVRSFPAPGEYTLRANNRTFGPLVVAADATPAPPATTSPATTDTFVGTTTGTTETDQPGFGVVVAVVALLAAALLAHRRD